MKTTWSIICKETSKLNNEGNINSIRIKDQVVYNKITFANELNSYFSNIAGSISEKRENIFRIDYRWLPIMEGSYRTNDHQIEYSTLLIQTIQAIMSLETLRMVYFAYIHSVISYGIILGGNQPYSDKIFKIK